MLQQVGAGRARLIERKESADFSGIAMPSAKGLSAKDQATTNTVIYQQRDDRVDLITLMVKLGDRGTGCIILDPAGKPKSVREHLAQRLGPPTRMLFNDMHVRMVVEKEARDREAHSKDTASVMKPDLLADQFDLRSHDRNDGFEPIIGNFCDRLVYQIACEIDRDDPQLARGHRDAKAKRTGRV